MKRFAVANLDSGLVVRSRSMLIGRYGCVLYCLSVIASFLGPTRDARAKKRANEISFETEIGGWPEEFSHQHFHTCQR
jgi:hypothetical protein